LTTTPTGGALGVGVGATVGVAVAAGVGVVVGVDMAVGEALGVSAGVCEGAGAVGDGLASALQEERTAAARTPTTMDRARMVASRLRMAAVVPAQTIAVGRAVGESTPTCSRARVELDRPEAVDRRGAPTAAGIDLRRRR
jgi:hypothetical protein